MYRMIQSNGVFRTLVNEGPGLAIALAIAEFFYKFHSFLLECIAFLATWFLISFVFDRIAKRLVKQTPRVAPGDTGRP